MAGPFSREEILARIDAGETFSCRCFYGHTARDDGKLSNAVFSQFYPAKFEIGGQTYHWAEQWMMASKARLFGDDAALAAILAAKAPEECKKLGRQVRNFDASAWDAAAFDFVTRGNLEKFGQSASLKAYLLDTGDEVIVEAAPRDAIWGVGVGREKGADPKQWRGLNLLGFALMRARAMLRGEIETPRGWR
jgi:hypothetical protein